MPARTPKRSTCWNPSPRATRTTRLPGHCWRGPTLGAKFAPRILERCCRRVASRRRYFSTEGGSGGPARNRSDPELPNGYVVLGNVQARRGKLLLAQEFYAKARALDPSHPEVLSSKSGLLAGTGFVEESLLMRQRLLALEPFVSIFIAITATNRWLNGETDAAIKIFKDLPAGPTRSGSTDLTRILAAAGRYGEAADAVSAMSGPFAHGTVEAATRLLRTAPAAAASPQTLPRLGGFDFVYLHVGVPDRALEFYEGNVEAGYSNVTLISWLWHPSYAPVRKTDRSQAFVHKARLVDYRRVKGWPEFCRPTTADDFVCE